MDTDRAHPKSSAYRAAPARKRSWETVLDFEFTKMAAHNFKTAGDGTHTIDGASVVVSGSVKASALAISSGGLQWTRNATGYTRLGIDVAALYTGWAATDVFRVLMFFPASQTFAAGDNLGLDISAQSGTPSSNNLSFTAQQVYATAAKVRTNQYYGGSWGTNVDVAATPTWMAWRVSGVSAALYRSTGAVSTVPDLGDMTLGANLHHKSGVNTTDGWGGNNRYAKIGFNSSNSGRQYTVTRLVIERLQEEF